MAGMASCLAAPGARALTVQRRASTEGATPQRQRTPLAALPLLRAPVPSSLCNNNNNASSALALRSVSRGGGAAQERRGGLLVSAAKGKKGSAAPPPAEEPSEPEISTEERLLALEAKFGRGGNKPLSSLNPPPPSPAASSPEPSKPVITIDVPAPVKQFWDYWLNPKKGGLVTLNDLAYKSIFVLAGAWVVFRFIGPLTGLYDLEDPLIPKS